MPSLNSGGAGNWDSPTAADVDVFDIPPKAPAPEALRRWRRATLALNAARRFRYTAKLEPTENAARFKATGHAVMAVNRFLEAGARARRKRAAQDASGDEEEASVALRAGGQFGFEAADLVKLVNRGKVDNLESLGGAAGIAKALRADPENGLDESEEEMERRVEAFGTNTYPKKPGKKFLEFLWDACQDRTLQILMVCAAISLAASLPLHPSDGWYEGTGIGFAVILCIVVTSISDYRQAAQFQNLSEENSNIQLQVMRGGRRIKISIYDVLVGDVVPLAIGDQVPGDGVFISGHSLTIDESSMTGESDPMHKDAKRPFLLAGCKVVDGFGTMIVTGVGVNTEWGKVMATISTDNAEETPLQVRLNGAATLIGKVGCFVALVVLIVLLARYFANTSKKKFRPKKVPGMKGKKAADVITDVVSIFAIAVTIIVVSVPEGLPLAVTLTLAYSMKKMMIDKALVRHLSACETMGSATAICSDKTGTLTLNQMTVVSTWVAGAISEADNAPLDKQVEILVFEAAALNSTGSVFVPEASKGGETEVTGSPTEAAILSWALKLGMNFHQQRAEATALHVETFNSAKKRAGVVVKGKDEVTRVHWKGASEIVLGMCEFWMDTDGTVRPLTADKRNDLLATIQKMAEGSLRTICMAYKEIEETSVPKEEESEGWEIPVTALICLAIVGIKDPCRPGVAQAVAKCQAAGIRVRMVTGDNAVTAKAIARECGIMSENGIVIEGKDFRILSPEEMREVIPTIDVMARSSPTDKHILVKMLRSMGEVVGVTGDGTNDAPALHEADIGLAMGISGTEVAKESADIVILDDNFASIVRVVRWGRSVYFNIQKFLQFQLTVNVVALTLNFIIAVSKGDGVPLTAVQLLWVNMIMDTFGALALATMPPSDELLEKKPVGRRDPIINNIMWRNIFGQAAYQLILLMVLEFQGKKILKLSGPKADDINRTVIFNAFVFCQIFNEINSRNPEKINVLEGFFTSYMFLAIIGFTVVFQFIIVTFLGKLADTVKLTWEQWIICIILGFLGMPIAVVVKLIPVPEKPFFEGWNLMKPFQRRKRRKSTLLQGQDQRETSFTTIDLTNGNTVPAQPKKGVGGKAPADLEAGSSLRERV